MQKTLLIPVEVKPHSFNQNELAIIRMGDDPEKFDHYIFRELNAI
jgi:hypothetical protein